MNSNDVQRIGTLTWQVEDQVGIIHLDRPARMNTLGSTMKADLGKVFFEIARQDTRVRAVIMTGTGERAFCAGADIKERSVEETRTEEFVLSQRATHDLFSDIERFEKPTIAALNGVALGGGLELALCCDLRIAATHARLGLPEIKLGIIPGGGGTQRLPRVIGAGRAKQLIYMAEFIDASVALEWGLVQKVVNFPELMPTALEWAHRIAAMPPLAIRMAKQSIQRGLDSDVEAGMEAERYAAGITAASDDRKEGMRAFVEKRTPVFTGR